MFDCQVCHLPIVILDDLIQVPLGIVNPDLAHTCVSGELINYHVACSPFVEVIT